MRVLRIISLMMVASCVWADSTNQGQVAINQALQQLQQLQDSARTVQQQQQNALVAGTTQSAESNRLDQNGSGVPPVVSPPLVTNPPPASTTASSLMPPASTQPTQTSTATPAVGVPQNSPPVTGSASDTAFQLVTSRLFPLTTDQIVQLREMYNVNQLAQVTTPGTPPRPTATSQFVSLSTGSTPPVIRLAQGFVSSLVFLDSTGAPWPITAYDLGDPKSFNIQWDRSSNTLMIQASQLYNYGNLAVRLEGLNTPVMLTLIPGQKAVDYRVDLRVQGYGPNAKMPSMGPNLPPGANSVLMSVLDGVPPPGSKLLNVVGGEAEAWEQGTKLFVRTRLTILSPGWMSFMTSADGMNAYEMQKAPVLLVSWHGKVMQLKIEGL